MILVKHFVSSLSRNHISFKVKTFFTNNILSQTTITHTNKPRYIKTIIALHLKVHNISKLNINGPRATVSSNNVLIIRKPLLLVSNKILFPVNEIMSARYFINSKLQKISLMHFIYMASMNMTYLGIRVSNASSMFFAT